MAYESQGKRKFDEDDEVVKQSIHLKNKREKRSGEALIEKNIPQFELSKANNFDINRYK